MKYKSLFDIWKRSSEQYSDLVIFTDNKASETVTYKQAFREVCFLAEKFKEFGLSRYENISLFSINSPRWLILEQAAITLGAICVSKSSEINEKELDYVFYNSESIALITDKAEIINYFINKDENFINNIKFIIYTGQNCDDFKNFSKIYNLKDILSELTDETTIKTDWEENPDDIAYINYTSGTSSMPKGAMLPNIGMSYVAEQLQEFSKVETGKTFVVTFPLSSAGGKSFNILCLTQGCRIMYTNYKEFYDVLDKYKPDYLHCAPKILQTMHSKLMTTVKEKGILFDKLYFLAFSISKLILNFERSYLYKNKFLFLNTTIKNLKKYIDKKIYKDIRNSLLKDETVIFAGSAHLAKPLEDYFEIMGIPLIQHYGLTETTGLAVSNSRESQQKNPYTVGVAFDGTTIEIIEPETGKKLLANEIGLITLGGIEILKGYFKNQEATKKAILPNGFLNTGDLGYVNEEGYLTVLSRYDDVIVMSNGYNVYTPLLENEAKDSEYINQIVITGHAKPFLTALIVLNKKEYNSWCNKNNLNILEPNNNEQFKTFLIEHINDKIKRKNEYRYYEKIKKVYFLKEAFTEENGLLTATLKIKYRKVCETYKNEIEKMYKGE